MGEPQVQDGVNTAVLDNVAKVAKVRALRSSIAEMEAEIKAITAELAETDISKFIVQDSDGLRWRASVVRAKRLVVDVDKILIADPALYERVRSRSVETPLLRLEIESGTAPGWQRYAAERVQAPSMRFSVVSEEE